MNIVANVYVLSYFKNIEYFEADLGWNFKESPDVSRKVYQGEKKKVKIKDNFIKTYYGNFGRIIFKTGKISYINFYDDLQLTNNELYVFKDNKIYEVEFLNEYKNDIRKFLSDLLESIDNDVIEHTSLLAEDLEGKIATNMGDIERPDISLPYDQYLAAMIKRRKVLSTQNND